MSIELATAYVSIVPSFEGGRKAIEAELSRVGDTAGKSISDSMASGVEKSSSKSGRLGKALGGIGGVIAGGFAGGAAVSLVTDAVSGFIREAEDAAKVSRETEAVLRSTGGAANVSAAQVDTLATALSNKSGIDDEVIASGENVLLTFTKVSNQVGAGNDVFNQATSIALDMSSALGTDLQGSVVQVGKALNDPIKGISALTRVGVTFTDQQKEQIKTLVESGDTLGAQKVILGELNTEFGGAAEAGATASGKLGVAWGNVQEQLGTALLPVLNKVSDWLVKELPGAVAWVQNAVGSVQAFFEEYRTQFEAVGKVLKGVFDFIVFQVKLTVQAVRVEFMTIRAIVDFAYNYVYLPLAAVFTELFNVVRPIVERGVAAVVVAWHAIEAVYTFFRDNVYAPVASTVGVLGAVVGLTFATAVATVQRVWSGISAVYTFFRDNVYNPLKTAVEAITNGTVTAFATAVDYVRRVWDGLKEAVAAPIRVVVGFYNSGIAGPWNFVADYVGLPHLKTIQFATGGSVPGSGDKDTVPAWLTPGEYVLTKDAAKAWGPELLKFLNDPSNARGKTVDPGIFGYAGGGPVYRPADDVLNFARQQVGKPYSYSAGGSGNADCSYLWSVIVNYALGHANPYTRRFSTGTIQTDSALAGGLTDLATGMNMGVRPPYQMNKAGQFVGHMAGTLMGVNFESTPPATRTGPGARGATSGFPVHYNLPGFGGPTAGEQAAADQVASLAGAHVGGAGGGMFGNLITALFNKLPGAVFDFLMKKLPEVIFNAVKTAVGDALGAVGSAASAVGGAIHSGIELLPGFEGGGTVPQTGPILVGENHPEILWANRGQYVQSEVAAARDRGPLLQVGAIFGDGEFRRMVRQELADVEFERRMAGAA